MTIREHIGYWPGGVTVVATDPRNGWVFAWEDLRGLVQVWHDRRIVDLFEIPDGMYPDLPTLDRARVYALGIPADRTTVATALAEVQS